MTPFLSRLSRVGLILLAFAALLAIVFMGGR
jgi:hypothetical protein